MSIHDQDALWMNTDKQSLGISYVILLQKQFKIIGKKPA